MKARLFIALALLVAAPLILPAAPISADVWYEFSFTAVGVDAAGCSPADPAGPGCSPSSGTPTTFVAAAPWTFDVGAAGASLLVTDAFIYGDSFDVFNFGGLVGSTPLVAGGGSCGSDPEVCVANALSSSASFNLGPGSYSITIAPNAIVSPGAAYFTVRGDVNPIPEPSTIALCALGLGLLSVRSISRRRKAAGQ